MIIRKLPVPLGQIEVRRINREIARFGARFAHLVSPGTDAKPPQTAPAPVPAVPIPARPPAGRIDAPATPAIPERKTSMSVATIIREGEARAARDWTNRTHADFVAQSFVAWGRQRNADDRRWDHGWGRAFRASCPDAYEDPHAVSWAPSANLPPSVRGSIVNGHWSSKAVAASWQWAMSPVAARDDRGMPLVVDLPSDKVPASVSLAIVTNRWTEKAIAESWACALAPFVASEEEVQLVTRVWASAGAAAADFGELPPGAIGDDWQEILGPIAAAAGTAPLPQRPRRRLWPGRRNSR